MGSSRLGLYEFLKLALNGNFQCRKSIRKCNKIIFQLVNICIVISVNKSKNSPAHEVWKKLLFQEILF